jgi:hypothetical protein
MSNFILENLCDSGSFLRFRIHVNGVGIVSRQTQNLLSVRTWEFKSPRPHQRKSTA